MTKRGEVTVDVLSHTDNERIQEHQKTFAHSQPFDSFCALGLIFACRG